MRYIIATAVILLSIFVIGDKVTPGGVMCVTVDVQSTSPRTTHDTDWVYCKTMDQIAGFMDSGNSSSLYNWIINSQLDGGLATTAWVSTKKWFNDNPTDREKFLRSLNPDQRTIIQSKNDNDW